MAKALGVFLLPVIFSVFSVSARAASVEKFHGAGFEKMVNGWHEIEPAVVSRVKQRLEAKQDDGPRATMSEKFRDRTVL